MAADAHLNVKITAQDDASPVVQSMTDKLKASREGLLAIGAASGVAFAGIASFLKGSLDAYAQMQTEEAQLNAVIKSTGGAAGVTAEMANKLADAIQNTTPISNDAVLSGESMLLTFTNIGKDVFPQATDAMINMATAMNNGMTPNAEMLKNTAIQLGKAINDPTIGLTALQRVGVSFTQQQKDQITTMYKAGQVAQAQTLILNELNREFGGSAQAQLATWGGQMQFLSNQVDDLQKVIGQHLMAVLKPLFAAIDPVLKSIMQWVNNNPELATQILLIAGALTGLVAIMAGIGLVLPSIIAGFGILTGPIGLVVFGVSALITVFVLFHKQIAAFFTQLNSQTGIITFFKVAWDTVYNAFKTQLLPAFKNLWDALTPLKPFLEALAQVIGAVLIAAIVLFVDWLKITILLFVQILKWLTDITAFIVKVFVGGLNMIIGALATIEGWWPKIEKAAKNMIDAVVGFFQPLLDMLNKIINAISNVASGIGSVIGGAAHAVGSAVSSIIPHADGGSVSPGQTYLVGERGPELFVSGSSGYIMPNHAMAGGGGITVNITGTFMSESAAVQMANKVVDVLKVRTRLGV